MSEWKPPKTKLRFESEIDPVPTMVVIKTEFAVDYNSKDAQGNPIVTPTETVKRVKLKSFTPNSNSEKFAQAVIEKSDLQPANSAPAVVKLLESLKKKQLAAEGAGAVAGTAAPAPAVAPAVAPAQPTAISTVQPTTPTTTTTGVITSKVVKEKDQTKEHVKEQVIDDRPGKTVTEPVKTVAKPETEEEKTPTVSVQQAAMIVAHKTHELGRKGLRKKVQKRKDVEPANIKMLEKYQSDLYDDDLVIKVRATGQILQLVQNPAHLAEVVAHSTLITALARVQQEDRKRSIALVANVQEVFFCFSSIRELHPLLVQHKVGATTMSIVDLELKRYNARRIDRGFSHTCDGLPFEGDVNPCKACNVLQQQERLLFVCLYVLLNLAENPMQEQKMVQRQLVSQVSAVLSHEDNDPTYLQHLHLLAVAFLKKLSLVGPNVVAMYREGVPARVGKLLSVGLAMDKTGLWFLDCGEHDCILANASLRLCYNLCFFPPARAFQLSMLPVLAPRVTHAATAQMAIRVLYHLTTDPHSQVYVAQALLPYLPAIVHTLIAAPGTQSDHELAALALNVATNARAARLMALPDGAALLLARAIRTRDVLLYRIVRVLTAHPFVQPILSQFASELAGAATNMKNGPWAAEARLEAVALLVNTDIRGIKYESILKHYPVADLVIQLLSAHRTDSDSALLGVTLLGTLMVDSYCAAALGTPKVQQMVTIIGQKALEEDDLDLLVQTLFTTFRMLHHSRQRSALVTERRVWDQCILASGHPNDCVRHYGECCADVLVEYGSTRARDDAIRRRFEQYNRDYMDFIGSGALDMEYDEEQEEYHGYADGMDESWRHQNDIWQSNTDEDDEMRMEGSAAVKKLPV